MKKVKYPQILKDLSEWIENLLKQNQVDDSVAERISIDVTEQIRNEWGGETVYIPRGVQYEALLLRQKVKKEFNGNNVKELSRRYKKSLQWVYEILREK